MNESYDKSAALVVLPRVSGGRLQHGSLRSWLAQADLSQVTLDTEQLAQLTGILGVPYPDEGLAALRMWGQTGEAPTVWIAAADPVYLEPRLDNLCVHDLSHSGLASSDFRQLIEHLQETLSGDKRFGFIRLGQNGYLRARDPIRTADVPAYIVDQKAPGDYLPEGADASGYRGLVSEVEMALHDHPVNQRRQAAGKPLVNSLWLWGGGLAPSRTTRSLPPLYADDPLLLGYWDSVNASASLWPGNLSECIRNQEGAGFVAVTPDREDDAAFLEDCLRRLRAALRQKNIDRVTILFRDGLRADIVRSQRFRFWRRDSPLLN